MIKDILKRRAVNLLILLIGLIIIFGFMNKSFLSFQNIMEITQFGAPLALLTIGEALVILLGNDGIDLSVGAMLSLSGVVFGLLVINGFNLWLSITITIITGIVLGLINGILMAYLKFPPMITTLGTMYIYGSIALYLNKGLPISGFPDKFSILSQNTTLGIPNQILFVVTPIAILTYYILHRTGTGRKMFLTGTNNQASILATIDTKKLRCFAYSYAGLLASIAAIIMCSWLMTAKADAGKGMEMKAITSAVLGGFSIKGGIGGVAGLMLAVLIITVTSSGLQISNINSIWELGILGLMLIIVVIIDEKTKGTNRR